MARLASKSAFDSRLARSQSVHFRDGPVPTRPVCFCWLEGPTACRWLSLDRLLLAAPGPGGRRVEGSRCAPRRGGGRSLRLALVCWWIFRLHAVRGGHPWPAGRVVRRCLVSGGLPRAPLCDDSPPPRCGVCVSDARRMGAEAAPQGRQGIGVLTFTDNICARRHILTIANCAVGVSLGNSRVLFCGWLHSCGKPVTWVHLDGR